MLKDVFTWWIGHLRELLPARLSGADRLPGTTLRVEAPDGAAGQVSLSLHGGRGTQLRNPQGLGRLALDAASVQAVLRRPPSRIVLCLPDTLLLGRDLVLPLAAERELHRVVGYEIDRVTPFAAAELFWTYAVRRRDRVHGRLALRLFLVTRASVEPTLNAMRDAGIPPTLLEAALPDGERVRFDLRGSSAPRSVRARRADRVLAVVCAVLVLAIAATPFIRQSLLLARVDGQIAALRPQVEAVEAVRRRMAAASAEVDVIEKQRLRLGDTLAVLAAVTDVLPDDTNLTDLALRGGTLTIGGQSAAAARLIAALAADPLLRNPTFAAPVTRLPDGGGDQFAVRAEIVP